MIRALILTCDENHITQAMMFPLRHYREALAGLGFSFDEVSGTKFTSDIEITGAASFSINGTALDLSRYDVLFFFGKLLKAEHKGENFIFRDFPIRKVLIDDSDSSILTYLNLIDYVDLYLTKYLFKDLSRYTGAKWYGGRIFSDYLIRLAYTNIPEPTDPPHPDISGTKDKFMVGWNLATFRYLYETFKKQDFRLYQSKKRKIDIHFRVKPSTRDWGEYHRKSIMQILKRIKKYKVVAEEKMLSREHRTIGGRLEVYPERYLNELRNSKILVAPFRLGEVNPRDFDGIMSGCLLVRPDVSHIETYPDLFVNFKTYIPVSWDLSDLEEKCVWYLDDEKGREEIVRNAEKVLRDFWLENGFFEKFRQILKRIGFEIGSLQTVPVWHE